MTNLIFLIFEVTNILDYHFLNLKMDISSFEKHPRRFELGLFVFIVLFKGKIFSKQI